MRPKSYLNHTGNWENIPVCIFIVFTPPNHRTPPYSLTKLIAVSIFEFVLANQLLRTHEAMATTQCKHKIENKGNVTQLIFQ
jgi:hypothetical protein